MKYFILIIMSLSLSCSKRYYTNDSISQIINKINASEISHTTNKKTPSINQTKDNTKESQAIGTVTVKIANIEQEKFTFNQYSSTFPYQISLEYRTNKKAIFNVTEDASGIYWKKRDLKLKLKNGVLYIKTPYRQLENYILYKLNNSKSNHSMRRTR